MEAAEGEALPNGLARHLAFNFIRKLRRHDPIASEIRAPRRLARQLAARPVLHDEEPRPMNFYIDCEWNGWQGELISIALVPENRLEKVFYAVLPLPEVTDLWVEENVIPVLLSGGPRIVFSHEQLASELGEYLRPLDLSVHVIADWPEDIAWLCRSIVKKGGIGVLAPHNTLSFEVLNIPYESYVPHNALFDAYAMRESHLNNKRRTSK